MPNIAKYEYEAFKLKPNLEVFVSQPVRVRFAPSPTGHLHVGGARTALYDYLYAKKNKGVFVLRVEDTDEERSTEESLRQQLADLQWLGLHWDEGVDPKTLEDKGDWGPYRQSQRKEIYKKYVDQLLEEGQAYYCFLTDDEVEIQRRAAKGEGRPSQVRSPYRDLSLEEAQKKRNTGQPAVVRFKTPCEKKDYHLKDLVRGDVNFPSDMVGDFVLTRSTGMPVYNFCCAVDDYLMKISHVFRGEEHLSNSLRQMMIYEALGWECPEFGHLSLILGEDRQKLSKRHGATSVNHYREEGFLPEAINNFLALLGWSSPGGQEVMSMAEMIDLFGTDRLNAAAAVFDEKRLRWFNATHLRALPFDKLWDHLAPLFNRGGLEFPDSQEWKEAALKVTKTSMETLTEALPLFEPLSKKPLEINEEALEVLSWESTPEVVRTWKNLVVTCPDNFMSVDYFGEIQNQIKANCGVKGKHLFMPIRTAITGRPHGAELKVLVPLLDKKTLLDRATQVLEKCHQENSDGGGER